MIKCKGCGITLQDKDPSLLGYTPKITNTYCERCFKTIHYNTYIKVNNLNNKDIIKKINNLKYFTIFITDYLNLNNEVIKLYKMINNQKVLVINKCDLLPSNLNIQHLIENIKKVYNIEDVLFISAKNKLHLEYLKSYLNDNNIIFCGETSSGKSTLINELFQTKLTTSKYQNTTLDFIKIKKDNYIIYDSPGFNIKEVPLVYNNIKCITKKLNKEYVYTIGDIKINGEGNITIFIPSNIKINSKKENNNLGYNNELEYKDIILNEGFIYIKNKINIKSNKELIIRDSIID